MSNVITWLLSRPLPFYTSFIGLIFATTTVILLKRKSRWGFISNMIQTGSWLVVAPLTGQWWYLITGVYLPILNWHAYQLWKREEDGVHDQGGSSRA